MRDGRTDIQATKPASRSERATGIQTNKPIPPWEQPGCFRLDCEPHRSTLLLWLAFPTFLPCFLSFMTLAELLRNWRFNPVVNAWGCIDGDCVLLSCLDILIFSACGMALALPSWLMAQHDLDKMRKGLMDPTDKNSTAGAWFFTRLGLIMNGCFATLSTLMYILHR